MAQRAAAWENMQQRKSSGWGAESMVCAVAGICNMTPSRPGPCASQFSLKKRRQKALCGLRGAENGLLRPKIGKKWPKTGELTANGRKWSQMGSGNSLHPCFPSGLRVFPGRGMFLGSKTRKEAKTAQNGGRNYEKREMHENGAETGRKTGDKQRITRMTRILGRKHGGT